MLEKLVRLAPLLGVIVLLATGCYRSSSVTPWLRTSSYREFELIAESGSGSHGWAKTERLRNGTWVQVSGSDRAIALADGKRAVYLARVDRRDRMMLTSEAGDIGIIECGDRLRVSPSGKSLVCVETKSHFLEGDESNVINVSRIDTSGKTTSRMQLTLPAKSVPRSFFPHFPGFLKDGTPVLTMHVSAEVETFRMGQQKLCAAFALRNDAVDPLLSLMTASWPDCDEASFWNHSTKLELVESDEF
jgi:hypothetical protein